MTNEKAQYHVVAINGSADFCISTTPVVIVKTGLDRYSCPDNDKRESLLSDSAGFAYNPRRYSWKDLEEFADQDNQNITLFSEPFLFYEGGVALTAKEGFLRHAHAFGETSPLERIGDDDIHWVPMQRTIFSSEAGFEYTRCDAFSSYDDNERIWGTYLSDMAAQKLRENWGSTLHSKATAMLHTYFQDENPDADALTSVSDMVHLAMFSYGFDKSPDDLLLLCGIIAKRRDGVETGVKVTNGHRTTNEGVFFSRVYDHLLPETACNTQFPLITHFKQAVEALENRLMKRE